MASSRVDSSGITIEKLNVIDENLIRESIQLENKIEKEERSQKQPEFALTAIEGVIDVTAIETLTLSFKNIVQISNLKGLERLTELRLDNNAISQIENLECLVNLTWLDLSFNNISKIEGLDMLTKLTDLSLFNNNISVLENMDTLTEMQVLSVGNNNIESAENLGYLRKFRDLRVVNLNGNPVCNDPEYRMVVLAHLSGLQFFDYVLVDPNEVTTAREQYQDELMELEEKEAIEEVMREKDAARQVQLARLREANLDPVETLFDDMFKEDTEMAKLNLLPGILDLIEDYREKLSTLSETLKTSGLAQHQLICGELRSFTDAISGVRNSNQQDSISLITEFKRDKKRVFRRVRQMTSEALARNNGYVGNGIPGGGDVHIGQLRERGDELQIRLMGLEMALAEQCEELMGSFETRYGAQQDTSAELHQNYFRAVETLENTYKDALTALASELLEKFAADSLEEEVGDDCRGLLTDREALMSAVNSSHDTHIGKLLAVEDDLRERATREMNQNLSTLKQEEWQRNRSRVAEIKLLLEGVDGEITAFRQEMLGRDEDDYE